MAVTTTWESSSISDFLKADPFAQEVLIKYRDQKRSYPIMDKEAFFSEIYTDIADGSVKVMNGNARGYKKQSYETWLADVRNTQNSLVVFIEGYAGCGKTIFVQNFLKNQLNTLDYDFHYYNYDIGAYYDNQNTYRIKAAIVECFLRQIQKCVLEGRSDIIAKLKELASQPEIAFIDSGSELYYQFTNTTAFDDAIRELADINNNEKNNKTFRSAMHEQLSQLNLEQVLALDYLFRIAKYIVMKQENDIIYICYDNMDAIENFDELVMFDNTLISIRRNIDCYINKTQHNFGDQFIPHFVILATYRKITVAKVDLRQHSERCDDFNEDNRFVFYLDLSHAYNYVDMVVRRRDYYERITKERGIDASRLMSALNEVVMLSKIHFVNKKFSNLWNNNYRTSSDILQTVFTEYENEVKMCVDLLNSNQDGYNETFGSHYGASAVFLNLVYKVFYAFGLWGQDYSAFVPRSAEKMEDSTACITSLPRLVLTYIANAKDRTGVNKPVSSKELFEEFKILFSSDEICSCLANMLTRNKKNTWRRPIYYHRNAINDNQQIIKELKKQWLAHNSDCINEFNDYSEFLLCECGYEFVERIFSEFEFFSTGIYGENHLALYLLSSIEEVVEIIDRVFKVVECCCINMMIFKERYIRETGITNSQFVCLAINPRTFSGSPQLYAERTIFSHISYIDHYRCFLMKRTKEKKQVERINALILERIEKYLEIYKKYILPVDSKRSEIADRMNQKINANRSARDMKEWLMPIDA